MTARHDNTDEGRSATPEAPPDVPPPGETTPLFLSARRARALSLGLLPALALSAALHAAALAWLGDRAARQGAEAAREEAAVAIILEAPPMPPAEPIAGEAAEVVRAEALSPVEPAESAPDAAAETAPLPAPSVLEPVEAVEAVEQAPALPPPEAEGHPVIALPVENVPVPTPRPQPPRAQADPPPPPSRKKAETPKKPAGRQPATAGSAPAAGRTGGATAGEKAAYRRRLNAHLDRYHRYPDTAGRLSGVAEVVITIDRRGRIVDARISRSAGHAIFDREALATARRASPYPRPPEGIGGKTLTFSVPLRFKP